MFNKNESLDLSHKELTEDSELLDLIERIKNGETTKGVRLG